MALFGGKKEKIGLCLGGGGARGFAHIGALKAFIEEGITFDMVAGTSVGSLIGGLYAAGLSPVEMEAIGEQIDLKEIHSGFKPNDPNKIGALVKGAIGDKNIEDLALPLFIVAVDMVEARQIIIDRGSLCEAVSASCAVPLFFRPVIKGDLHLVDGGLLNNIPADILRMMGCDRVVTVDINPTRGAGTDGVGIFDMIKGTLSIVTASASQIGLINSDIIIAPDMSKFKATKKDGHDEMILLGYQAAKEKMAEIKELFGIKVKEGQERLPMQKGLSRAEKKAFKSRLKAEKKARKAEKKSELAIKKLIEETNAAENKADLTEE